MTRYRVVCPDGQDLEQDLFDSREAADKVRVDRDFYFGTPGRCAPHRVEEVPDGDA